MSAIKRLAGRFAGIVAVLLATALFAEAVLSWLAPQALLVIEPGLYEADPPGRYRLSPGYRGAMGNRVEFNHGVAVDERGLRMSGSASGQRSVMFLGDSFTFGMGVEDDETLVARFAELAGVEPLNGGLPGTGIPDLVGWYERHGRRLEPDMLVLAIFVGNDLADARPDRQAVKIVDGLVAPADTPAGIRSWLYRHSDLVRLSKTALGSPALAGLRSTLGLAEPWVLRNLRWEFSTYALEPPAELLAAEAATDEAVGRLAAMCEEDGTELVALLLPARIQLAPEAWDAALAMIGLDPASYDPSHPRVVFERLLDSHGIPHLDLAPAFAAALASGELLYYRKDRHWTAAGHALAARQLADFLQQLGVPGSPAPPPGPSG